MRILAALLLITTVSSSQSRIAFSVVEISRQFDSAGRLKSESRSFFATNNDGSIVSVDLEPGAEYARQIIDRRKHRTIVINNRTGSASVVPYHLPYSLEGCEQRFRFIIGAAVSVDKSAGVLHGVSVERVSVSLPDGAIMEILLAPQLSCHMLQTQLRRNGLTLHTQSTEDLQIGEPDPRLFEIPAGYRVLRAEWAR